MTYLITGLALAAAVFYGLWQRGRAGRAKDDLKFVRDVLAQERADRAGDAFVSGNQIWDLERRLAEARRILNATQSDASLRDELGSLLTPPGRANAVAPRVSDGAAAGDGSAGVPAVPAGPGGLPGPEGSGGAA